MEDHLGDIARASIELHGLVADHVPEKHWDEVDHHMDESGKSLTACLMGVYHGSVSSALHAHDAVRHLGNIAALITKHAKTDGARLVAAQAMSSAKAAAAGHEQYVLSGFGRG